MQRLKSAAFIAVISISLAVPAVAAYFLSAKVQQADDLMRKPIIQLPETLGIWRRSHGIRDTAEPNIVRVEYDNSSKRRLFVIIQRGSTFGSMHDLNDCLVATGGIPTFVKTVACSSNNGQLNANLVRTKIMGTCSSAAKSSDSATSATLINHLPETANDSQDLHRFLSLMWFQNSIASAPSRWAWRCALLKNALHGPIPPVYHQVEVALHESPNFGNDVSQLSDLAARLHSLSL